MRKDIRTIDLSQFSQKTADQLYNSFMKLIDKKVQTFKNSAIKKEKEKQKKQLRAQLAYKINQIIAKICQQGFRCQVDDRWQYPGIPLWITLYGGSSGRHTLEYESVEDYRILVETLSDKHLVKNIEEVLDMLEPLKQLVPEKPKVTKLNYGLSADIYEMGNLVIEKLEQLGFEYVPNKGWKHPNRDPYIVVFGAQPSWEYGVKFYDIKDYKILVESAGSWTWLSTVERVTKYLKLQQK